ncbi:MAG: HIT domain-containing protein [Melioribacteraceae bacterium]|nr:HIT domain-containing protein [Melioribacteraceae bacterium]
MEKLWSPWRSNYIDSFKDKDKNEECVFCKAASENPDDDSSLVVYKGSNSFIVLNLYPYNGGHLMIVPNRHINHLLELTENETLEIFKLSKLSIKALINIMKPQGFNYGANIGKAAGAGIDTHLHYHILPRWNGDTNFMPTIGEVKVISQDLLDIKRKLQKEIKELI